MEKEYTPDHNCGNRILVSGSFEADYRGFEHLFYDDSNDSVETSRLLGNAVVSQNLQVEAADSD